jgi:Arc/MetJ-type ribon-helix-helix transcriptional regulator
VRPGSGREIADPPADLERFVPAEVRCGRFTSSDEAISAAVRLLRQHKEAVEPRETGVRGAEHAHRGG